MWFGSCKVCSEKDRLIVQVTADLLVARGQLDASKEREYAAINALLEYKMRPVISTPGKMKATQGDEGHKALFGFFTDEKDDGKGSVLEADKFPDNGVGN